MRNFPDRAGKRKPWQPTNMEDRRIIVTLLSGIVSQSLLFHLLSPSSPSRSLSFDSNSGFNGSLFFLLHEFLSTQQIAVSMDVTSASRKRKRARFHKPDSDPSHPTRLLGGPELGGQWMNHYPARSPDSFRTFFKMKSQTFEWLLGLLEPLLECRDPIGSSINLSAELRLVIGLYRLASGSNYSEVADRFGVTETVARFCVKKLCRVLCTNFRFWVAFPGPDDLKSVSSSFEDQTGLPNCCGVLVCTRFKVVVNDANNLFDEKLETKSFACQVVVDSSSRILSVVAGFHGDKSDSTVLKLSTLYKDIEEGKLLNSSTVNVNGCEINQYLIGHYGYTLLPWLMVPFTSAMAGTREDKFNEAINLMLVHGSKAFAGLKNWGVLSKPMREEFKTAVGLIGACSILHNVLLMREDDSAFCGDSGEQLLDEQSSMYIDSGDNFFEDKASIIRNALAIRAAEFCTSSSDRVGSH